MTTANEIINFWFNEIPSSNWWKKDENFDLEIKNRYEDCLLAAAAGELFSWRDTARGRLAEVIVLDQFSRNIYRDTPKSFQQDSLALCLAQEAVNLQMDKQLSPTQCSFLYMPYMHSESRIIHKEAVKLFEILGNDGNLDFELKHQAIIERFGRYPHRNKILGRESTEEELEFLTQPGSSF